mgnify:CR=1 FL=1
MVIDGVEILGLPNLHAREICGAGVDKDITITQFSGLDHENKTFSHLSKKLASVYNK